MILSLAFVFGTQMTLCSFIGYLFIMIGATAYCVLKNDTNCARAFPLPETAKRRTWLEYPLIPFVIVGLFYIQLLRPIV